MVNEHIVSKAAIVGMMVLDLDAMVGGKLFEGNFCLDRFFQWQRFMKMNVS